MTYKVKGQITSYFENQLQDMGGIKWMLLLPQFSHVSHSLSSQTHGKFLLTFPVRMISCRRLKHNSVSSVCSFCDLSFGRRII